MQGALAVFACEGVYLKPDPLKQLRIPVSPIPTYYVYKRIKP